MKLHNLIPALVVASLFFAFSARADDTAAPVPPASLSPFVGELQLGVGVSRVGLPVSGPGIDSQSIMFVGQAGLAAGYRLNPNVALLGMFDAAARADSEGVLGTLFVGGGVGFALHPLQLDLGAGYATFTNGVARGLGLLARGTYLLPGHTFGPFLQVEGDLLNNGYNQVAGSVGIQFDFF